jgi:Sec7-like guanine-nucleotide exchange factor
MNVTNVNGLSQGFDLSKEKNVNIRQQNDLKNKDAVTVDITRETKINENKELSSATQKFIESKNIDMAKESQNFSSQNVLSQMGSLVQSQSNAQSSYVQKLIA